MTEPGDFITLARVLKTQGRHGEVAVEAHSVNPERFQSGMRLFALGDDGARRQVNVEDVWPHKGQLVLRFAGIDSISEAEPLIGCELQVPREERAQLESGWIYVSDLVGCTVFDREREVGIVGDVQFGAGEAPLLIVGKEKHEVPFAEAYLIAVDVEHKQIRMQFPEGLLDVNAPLTQEEKERQRSSE